MEKPKAISPPSLSQPLPFQQYTLLMAATTTPSTDINAGRLHCILDQRSTNHRTATVEGAYNTSIQPHKATYGSSKWIATGHRSRVPLQECICCPDNLCQQGATINQHFFFLSWKQITGIISAGPFVSPWDLTIDNNPSTENERDLKS